MGHIFTFVPKRPHGEISVVDPAEIFRPVEKIRKSKKFIWLAVILIVGIFCGLCAAYFHVRYLEKSIAAEEKAEEKVEEKVEEQLPQAVDDQNKTQETISQ